ERHERPEKKRDRDGELRPQKVVVDDGGLGLGAKLGILVVIAVIAAGAYMLRQSHESAPTPVGGGRTVAFGGVVDPTALVVAGVPATRFTAQKANGVLEVVYFPDLPPGKGVDVVVTELYGPGVKLTSSGARLGGVLFVHGDGDLTRDKATQPGKVHAYVGDKEAWILAATGNPSFLSSAET